MYDTLKLRALRIRSERERAWVEQYSSELERIRMMRNHYSASSIPPSEIPSGAQVKEGLPQASSTNYRYIPSAAD